MHQCNSRKAYEQFINRVVDEIDNEWLREDPLAIASRVIASIERVEDDTGLTRTYGMDDLLEETLYPTDVIAFSEQPYERVIDKAPNWSDVDNSDITYAHWTFICDLADEVSKREYMSPPGNEEGQ